jgi:TRAP transporter TAXI family solute receptor
MRTDPLRLACTVSRRSVIAGAVAAASAALTGCRSEPAAGELWHHGRLYVATGNTTGVFYQFGGGYADIITRYVTNYQATAEPSNGAVENIGRVLSGNSELGLTFADAAADVVLGRYPVAGQGQTLRAIARVYDNYSHVIARTALGLTKVAQLKGKRISTGTHGSGTENVAVRLLRIAGLDPDVDVTRLPLSLPDTVKAIADGTVDALFWMGGLPALGISDLMRTMGNRVTFVPTADLLPDLQGRYGDAYRAATIGRSVYSLPSDISTIAVGAMVVVTQDMPETLAFDVTRVLFEHQDELAKAHPEGRNFTRESARKTAPVTLHPGAARYYA